MASLFSYLQSQVPNIHNMNQKFVYTQFKKIQDTLGAATTSTIDGIILQALQGR